MQRDELEDDEEDMDGEVPPAQSELSVPAEQRPVPWGSSQSLSKAYGQLFEPEDEDDLRREDDDDEDEEPE